MRITLSLTTALAAAALIAAPASAQILYSDTFSRVTGSGDGNGDPNGADPNFSDWGTNDNGLGGSNMQAWIAGPSRAGGGRNAVTDGDLGLSHGTTSMYDYDAAGAAPNGFKVALDFSRFVATPDPGPGPGGYIAIGLGVDTGATINDGTAINASDFSILFQQANNGNAANADVREDTTVLESFDYLDPDGDHTLLLTVIPAVAGAYGDADLVSINVLIDGAISKDYAVLGGANFGSFTVSANNFEPRSIDNLIVTAIPEPSALALACLGLVGVLRRRRA